MRPSERPSGETHKERVDRELVELLGELRVALPGVQVLFAFLLTAVFTQRFGEATPFQKVMYLVTLGAAALSIGLLVAPAAQHRILFRKRTKDQLLKRANRYASWRLVSLLVAIVSAIVLVVDFIFELTTALVMAGTVGTLLLWWWVVLPLTHRNSSEDGPGEDAT